jgi:hypothetical protein
LREEEIKWFERAKTVKLLKRGKLEIFILNKRMVWWRGNNS